MLPYILTFLVSILAMYLLNKGKQSFAKQLLGGVLVILPLALLGAFRDANIGTDLQFYGIQIWEYTVGSINKASDMEWYGIEKSYLLLNYVCSLFSNKLEFFLFVLQMLTLIPIYLAAVKARKYASPVLVMFMYIFVFYNATFNTMRQSVALSVTFLAFMYLFLDKRKIAYALYFLSLLLHGSAILAFLVLGVYYVLTHFQLSRKQISIIAGVVVICFVGGIIYVDQVITLAVSGGLIDDKYVAYTSSEEGGLFGTRLNKSTIVFDSIVFYILYKVHSKNKKDKKLYALSIIALMSLLFEFTGLISMYLPRIAQYPRMITLFSIPYVMKQIECRKLRGNLSFKTFFIAFVVFFWFYAVVLSRVGETCPYTSKILGI